MRSLISITILFTAMSITTVVTDETDETKTAIKHCKTLLTKYCKFKNDQSDYVAINYNGNLASVVPEEILMNIDGELLAHLTKNMKYFLKDVIRTDIQDDKMMSVAKVIAHQSNLLFTGNLNKRFETSKTWNIGVEEVKQFIVEFQEMLNDVNLTIYDDTLNARRVLFRLLNQYLKFIIEDAVKSLNEEDKYYNSTTTDLAIRFSQLLYDYLKEYSTTSKDLSDQFDSFIPDVMTPAPKVAQFLNQNSDMYIIRNNLILKPNPVDHFCQDFIKNNGAKELFLIILAKKDE